MVSGPGRSYAMRLRPRLVGWVVYWGIRKQPWDWGLESSWGQFGMEGGCKARWDARLVEVVGMYVIH